MFKNRTRNSGTVYNRCYATRQMIPLCRGGGYSCPPQLTIFDTLSNSTYRYVIAIIRKPTCHDKNFIGVLRNLHLYTKASVQSLLEKKKKGLARSYEHSKIQEGRRICHELPARAAPVNYNESDTRTCRTNQRKSACAGDRLEAALRKECCLRACTGTLQVVLNLVEVVAGG